jgi:hypothetical protein
MPNTGSNGFAKDLVAFFKKASHLWGRCPSCGTPLFSEAESRPHLIFVRVGTFDDPNLANPAMTIWPSSSPRWACIDAELPQVERQPPPAA